ncbi:hypothetical protein [Leyella stercorea]|uniref:hypothetical protein n=1 Tax=Leyella stercorea TaxID=363265 RepID=UPI00242BC43C|nr:hypothetical protein [Leyella stercorea]
MVTNNVTAEFVIRIDRRRCPHRPTQMSVSTDADVCICRCGSKQCYYNHVSTARLLKRSLRYQQTTATDRNKKAGYPHGQPAFSLLYSLIYFLLK